MAEVRPFRALRPRPDLAARVAAPPYDVVDVAEARALAAGNEVSFLHVSRPEIDLPDGVDPTSDAVHAAGRSRLDALVARGQLLRDGEPSFYVYRQIARLAGREHVQTGIVALTAVADYDDGTIRTHEHTRPDKEDDRVRHIDALDAHDEPVLLLTAPDDPAARAAHHLAAPVTRQLPLYDVVTDDGIAHRLWRIADPSVVAALTAAFASVPSLYVADGHHRSAAASRVAALRAERITHPDGDTHPDGGHGTDESDAFLAVIFPGEELAILPYHRVVTDLVGRTLEQFLDAIAENADVGRIHVKRSAHPVTPSEPGVFGMYCAATWYELHLDRPVLHDDPVPHDDPVLHDGAVPDDDAVPHDGAVPDDDPVARLDVSLLQDRILGPVLGIADPRTDRRIGFVGGIRGTAELERLVDSGRYAVAFTLSPTSVTDLVAVASRGRVMPPKSTWFEPKLRSGLFVHRLT